MSKYDIVPASQIPYGFCHCNCGNKTTIHKRGRADRNQIKGEPALYLSGHNPASGSQRGEDWAERPHKNARRCDCGGWKTRGVPMCRECWIKDGKPPEDPNTYLIHGQLRRRIPLTQNKYAWVYASDYYRLSQYIYYALYNPLKDGFYARRSLCAEKLNYGMHVDVVNPAKGKLADHIRTDDTLNNCRDNLREATHSQNTVNRKKGKHNTSGRKNVRKNSDGTYWVRVAYQGVSYEYGPFRTFKRACEEQVIALKKHHGEFANTGEKPMVEHSDNWLKHAVIATKQ